MAIDSYAVNENRAAAQDSGTLQFRDLGGCARIGSFRSMDQERPTAGNILRTGGHIGGKAERVSPSKSLHYAHRKPLLKSFVVRIVVCDGGHSAQEIFQSTPPETDCLRNCQVLLDGRTVGMVNVLRPGGRIGIRAAAQPGKQIELQMVVRINQSGQDQMAVKIQLRPGVSRRPYSSMPDFEIDALSRCRAASYSGAGQPHGFVQHIARRAGIRLISANEESFPAWWKISCSGASKQPSRRQSSDRPADSPAASQAGI